MDAVVTIKAFKEHLQACGYAPATIEIYRKGLDEFARYLNQQKITDLRSVSPDTLLEYRQILMSQSIALESKALKIRPVKRLFEHLTGRHRLLLNPAEGIVETCRKQRKTGAILTIDETRRLFTQPDPTTNIGVRDRAVMQLLYSTGIRLGELLSLKLYHVDFKDQVLYVRRGKGNTQRVVPLGKSAAQCLGQYMEKTRPGQEGKNTESTQALFLNRFGRPLAGGSVHAMLRKYRRMAGIKKPVSPHTFRRTCATHLLQQGADIRYIQELLGHKHLGTTQIYTRVLPVEVKQTHQKAHPQL